MNNDYQQFIIEDIRLIILRALAAEDNGTMHEGRLEFELQRFGYNKTREFIRNQLTWLESEVAAVRTSIAGTVMIATIRKAGRSHIDSARFLPEVKRPSEVD